MPSSTRRWEGCGDWEMGRRIVVASEEAGAVEEEDDDGYGAGW